MAKRRRRSSSGGGMGGVKSIVRQAGMGLLGAMVVGAVAKKFVPQASGFAAPVGAYLTGGVPGVLASLLISGNPLAGQAASTGVEI